MAIASVEDESVCGRLSALGTAVTVNMKLEVVAAADMASADTTSAADTTPAADTAPATCVVIVLKVVGTVVEDMISATVTT